MSTASQHSSDKTLCFWLGGLPPPAARGKLHLFSKAKYKSGDYQVRVSGLHSCQSPAAGLGTARPG